MLMTPCGPARNPVLLIHQVPSWWRRLKLPYAPIAPDTEEPHQVPSIPVGLSVATRDRGVGPRSDGHRLAPGQPPYVRLPPSVKVPVRDGTSGGSSVTSYSAATGAVCHWARVIIRSSLI
jgi:hypothetical protein